MFLVVTMLQRQATSYVALEMHVQKHYCSSTYVTPGSGQTALAQRAMPQGDSVEFIGVRRMSPHSFQSGVTLRTKFRSEFAVMLGNLQTGTVLAQAKAIRLNHESITPCETDKKTKIQKSEEFYFTMSVCLAQT
jgi:hypothetical protein